MRDPMVQTAPYPDLLLALVRTIQYRPGWVFDLVDLNRGQGSRGLTLVINITGPNAYHPADRVSVDHFMVVPAAAYDYRSWRRWLFEQVLLVERHEAMEWFQVTDELEVRDGRPTGRRVVDRPYAPSHGPGNDPYMVREVGTDSDRRTSFLGEVSPQ